MFAELLKVQLRCNEYSYESYVAESIFKLNGELQG